MTERDPQYGSKALFDSLHYHVVPPTKFLNRTQLLSDNLHGIDDDTFLGTSFLQSIAANQNIKGVVFTELRGKSGLHLTWIVNDRPTGNWRETAVCAIDELALIYGDETIDHTIKPVSADANIPAVLQQIREDRAVSLDQSLLDIVVFE